MTARATKTNAEHQARVTKVQGMLLDGHSRSYIIEATEAWDVSSRTIDEYISKAKETIEEINKKQREENMAVVISNLWSLFRSTKTRAEFSDAHKILMSIAKLAGLEETVIHHTVSERPLAEASTKELRALADKLQSGKR